MEILRVEIVNKKARKILNELADLNFINIQKNDPKIILQQLLNKLRSGKEAPSLDEITKEVRSVRTKQYAKKG